MLPPELNPPPNPGDGDPPNLDCDAFIASPPPNPSDLFGLFLFNIPAPAPKPGEEAPPNVDDCFPFITPGVPKLDPNPPPNPGEEEPMPGTPLLIPPIPGGESEDFVPPLTMPGPGPNPGVVAVVFVPDAKPVEDDAAFPNAELDFIAP